MLLNTRDLQLMNAFEKLTRVNAVDCFEAEDSINFIVEKGELGKAIGKGGATITNARKQFGKRIVIMEDNDDPRQFILNACKPVKVSPMIQEDYVKIDAQRNHRDEMSGKQIRIIKEAVKRKLKVSKVDFNFV